MTEISASVRNYFWWGLLLIGVPLAYNPYSRWQYEPDKIALVLLCAGALIGRVVRRGTLARPDRAISGWIAAYLLARWVSLAGSSLPHWSLWGDASWRSGLLATLAGIALFLASRSESGERREPVILLLLVGSLLVCGYGLGGYLRPGHDLRMSGTMAHANILSAYLAMILPLTVYRLLTGKQRLWIGVLLGMQIACLILTYSRAGWLAALTGLAVFGLGWLWSTGRRRTSAVLGGGLVIGLGGLVVLSLLPPLPGTAPHPLQTLTSLFRWKGATAQIRLLGWQASLDAIRERPLLGHGPATFRAVLEWYLPPKLAPFGGAAALGGRPHNAYLEIAVESGLIGLSAYLGLISALLLPLLRSVTRADISDSRLFQAAALAALVANLLNGFFSFDTAITGMLFWVLAGMAQAKNARLAESQRYRQRRAHLAWGAGMTASGAILAGLIVGPDMLAYRGETLAKDHRWDKAVIWLRRAETAAPLPEVFQASRAQVYADWAAHDPSIWLRGAAIGADLVQARPGVVEYHRLLGTYLNRWFVQSQNPDVGQQAVRAYDAAIRLSPRNPDLWLDRALIRVQVGDVSGAWADINAARVLLDDYARVYGVMSIAALVAGDGAAAQEWNARALELQQEWDDWVWRR